MNVDGKCWYCGTIRPLTEMTAFWPAGDRQPVHYVCRPDGEVRRGACFRASVGPRYRHAIAPALEVAA